MPIAIAQTRQQLPTRIEAAQSATQIVAKRNAPVGAIVSADYFKRTEVAANSADSVYSRIMAARAAQRADDTGLVLPGPRVPSLGRAATASLRPNDELVKRAIKTTSHGANHLLTDTNVVNELVKKSPDANVLR